MSSAGLAFVTGATGFVGSHLVDLLAAGGARIRCLVRGTSSTRWLPAGVETSTAPLGDHAALCRAMEGAQAVYHLAAATAAADEAGYRRANIEMTAALVAAMRDAAPQARLVLCSTLAVAGPATTARPVTEEDPPAPIGPYGATKLAAERIVAESGLDHVIVRPPTVYGPRDRDILAVFRFARFGIVPSFAPGGQLLSLVHASDLAAALRLTAERGRSGRVYYVADGPPHSWSSIVSAMGAAVGRRVRFVRIPLAVGHVAAGASCTVARLAAAKPLLTPERVRNMAQAAWTCDDTRARNELGFAPAVPLAEGMTATAQWYRAEGWL